MKHTQGQWDVVRLFRDAFDGEHYTIDDQYLTIVMDDDNYAEVHGPNQEANAKRIWDSVNALAGMNPEAVGRVVRSLEEILDMLDRWREAFPSAFGETPGCLVSPQTSAPYVNGRTALSALEERS